MRSVDGSAPAPKFNVVEQPNDWAKIAKQPANYSGGAAVQLKYDYWTAFNDYAFDNSQYAATFNRRKASSDHWYTLAIGSSAANIKLLVNTRDEVITLELTIHDSKELYDKLVQHKQEIEQTVGATLDWRRMSEKKACRILLERNAPVKDETDWPTQFDWFMQTSTAFKKAFSPFL